MKLTDDQVVRYQDRKVVLVDEGDNELGETDLISAHRDGGRKHRAFSLVLYRKNSGKREVLLQRRALVKPIFSGLWANTCCYNLAPGEEIVARARSRVTEELGVELGETELVELYAFSYEADDKDGFCENEVDHVVVGEWSGEVVPNPYEVMDYLWIEWSEMREWAKKEPEVFAPWWKLIVEDGKVEKYLQKKEVYE